jgi:hypothetical protein
MLAMYSMAETERNKAETSKYEKMNALAKVGRLYITAGALRGSVGFGNRLPWFRLVANYYRILALSCCCFVFNISGY